MTLNEYITLLQVLQAEGHGQLRVVKEYDSYSSDLDEDCVVVGRVAPAGRYEIPVFAGADGFDDESNEQVVIIRQ